MKPILAVLALLVSLFLILSDSANANESSNKSEAWGQYVVPVVDGITRDYTGIPTATFTSNIIIKSDKPAIEEAALKCLSDLSSTFALLQLKGMRILEVRPCRGNDTTVGDQVPATVFSGKIYFTTK